MPPFDFKMLCLNEFETFPKLILFPTDYIVFPNILPYLS
jgi:hypothetical protein